MSTFRFDPVAHVYTDLQGAVIPHITGMLERTGWIDDAWFTEESAERGVAVHELTARYDLGALDLSTCVSIYRSWLLGHVECMARLKPTWDEIEIPRVHAGHRFAGRPDRIGTWAGLRTVLEIKSGTPQPSHKVQTALQAVLVSAGGGLPPASYVRLCEYLRPNGKWALVQHRDRRDFDEARRVLKECC